jgi:branched-chain amino acid transport system permease protein
VYWVDVLDQVLIFGILAMSLNLLLGYAGQVSIAHAAFAAIGGYAGAYLSSKHGWPAGWAIGIGMVGAFVIGMLVSLPALLLRSEFVILLTLSVQTIILVILTSVSALGGALGLVDLPSLHVTKDLIRPGDWLLPLIVLTLIVYGICAWIGESPFGRILRGIREDQLATQSLGKDVWLKKVVVFGVSSGIAALGGAMLAFYNGIAAPGLFGFSTSILIVAMVVLGGRGNLLGSLLGAGIVTAAGPFFEKVINLEADKAALARLLAFGLLLIVVLLLRPQGLLAEGWTPMALVRHIRQLRRPWPVAARAVDGRLTAEAYAEEVASLRGTHRVEEARPVVTVTDVSKAFGGIRAVDGLSFELLEGRITGLIGPNGAGKTTVYNLLTGTIPPDAGTVRLRGEDITGWPIDRVARAGMVRSFQDVRIFPGLTVLDNVKMAVPGQRGEKLGGLVLTPWRVMRDASRTDTRARLQLDFVGLTEKANVRAGDLPFGEQKLVALARILAAEAEVLLLDEPASGIDAEWVDRMIDIIVRLRDHGLTVCIVEHNLHVVERMADQIYFMEEGRISKTGTMQDLVEDKRLVEVYFGQP